MAKTEEIDYSGIWLSNSRRFRHHGIEMVCTPARPRIGCCPDAIGLHLHIDIVICPGPPGSICLGPFTAKKLSEELAQEVDQLFVTLTIETLTQ